LAISTASKVSVSEPIWFTLTRIELAVPVSMPFLRNCGVGDEEVVADELHAVADGVGELLPGHPVVFGAAVFDRDDRIFRGELAVELDHLVAGEDPTGGLLEDIVLLLGFT
jgi:hypothetical protein